MLQYKINLFISRIQLQQEKIPSSLLLYHYVGRESSVSADPIMMMRRLTAQVGDSYERVYCKCQSYHGN